MPEFILRVVYLGLLVISSDTLELIKDGGAREEGFESMFNEYSGVLNYVNTVWLALALGCVMILLLKYYKKIKREKQNLVALPLLLFAASSCLWAQYPYPALRTSLLIAISILIVYLAVRVRGIQAVISDTSNLFFVFLLASLFVVFFIPDYGVSVGINHEGAWQGIFNHKNQLGNICATAYVLFLTQRRLCRQRLDIIKILLAIILAVGSQSYTALTAMFVASAMYVFVKDSKRAGLLFKMRYMIVGLALLTSALAVFLSTSNYSFQLFDKDITFSNRNAIWLYMLAQVLEAPYFGHGVDQLVASLASNSNDFFTHVGFVVGSSHNGFIELAYALGVAGVIFYAVLVFRSLLRFNSFFPFLIVYFLSFISINTFESKMFGFNIFFMIFILYVEISFTTNRDIRWSRAKTAIGNAFQFERGRA